MTIFHEKFEIFGEFRLKTLDQDKEMTKIRYHSRKKLSAVISRAV